MAKQLNVDLNFKANTSQAQAAIQSLVNDLNKINNGTGLSKDIAITSQIREAQMAAGELSHALQNAFNVDTGKLDLNKLSTNLKSSGMSLTDYGNKLAALGPTGDQAFLKIAQSIVATEAPLRRSSGLLKEFSTTLANTARWQISSSILHGFLGSVQKAYGYAQDLNESLNNIRIVTNKSSDDMANFAKNANKAAKELSTTTTAYTNAALIYYQQGDDDQTVLEKTNVTAKMANVTGTSAETVSDQLTAIWNNFNASGEESYEKYADILTALGAATASSTDEIAGGLEKFAAVADTIGLSYEYAASALATITAKTRQSEDVVGTALKTIFARIQGLNLGETLDDGTTLNKYSEALQKVGISIFDSTGQMKKMDDILDEMGSKWQTLSKDQQVALAQTVAGVRQYNQLVSLMDSWDFMEKNLEIANNSQGTLDGQAAIYEESWAASSERVRASLESIWDALIDDDFFIGLNDGISHVVDTVKILIDSMGGVKGVVAGLGLVLTTVFKNNITDGINNALHNFRNFTGVSKKELESLQTEAYEYAQAMTAGLSDSLGVQAQRDHLSRTYTMQKELQTLTKGMSDEQLKVAQSAYDTAQAYSEAAEKAGQMADEAERASIAQREASSKKFGTQMSSKMQDSVDLSVGLAGSELIREAQSMVNSANVLGGVGDEVQRVKDAISAYGAELRKAEPDAATLTELSNNLRTAMENLGAGAGEAGTAFASYQSVLTDSATQVSTAAMHIQELQIAFDNDNVTDTFINELQEAVNKAKEAKLPVEELEKALNAVKVDKSSNNIKQLGVALKQTSFDTKTTTKAIKELGIEKVGKISQDSAERLKGMGDALNADAEAAGLAARRQLEFENATNEANNKVSQLKDKLFGAGLAYQSLGSAITGTLRGMSSFAMGLQSLSSIKDTLENTDLSSWEKTLQIMMSLGMAIPMVTTGLKSLGDGFLFVTSASTKGLAGQLAYMLGLDLEKLKTEEVIVVKGKEILARGKAGDAAVVEAAKKEGATVVTELDTAATWKNIAAKLIQHWYIGLIILAIGALIAIIYKSIEAYNADAEAAKEAAAQAQSLTDRYNELTKASNKFRESCKGYEDAVKSFKDLEKGAEGYEEALKKANDEAKKLIETYGLYDDYEVKDGLITFKEDENGETALDRKQREMDVEVRKAEGQKYQANIYANNANLKSQATNTSRKTSYFGTGTYTYTESGAYENYRQLTGDEAQAIGKVINDFKEANEGVAPSAEQVKQALEDLGSESGLASDAMNNLDTIITEDTIGKFGDLADSMTEAQKANEYYTRQIMGIAVEEKYGDELRKKATDSNGNFDQQKYNQLLEVYTQRAVKQDSQSDKDLADKYSEIDVSDVSSTGDLNKILSGAKEETLKAIFGDEYFSSINNDEELAKAYAQMMGYGDADTLSYKGGSGKGSITDATGKKVLDNMNDEIMRREIAKQIQMQQITEQYTKNVGQNNEAFDGALDSLMSGAEAAGAKYGGDFQSALLNALSTEDKKIDLNSLFDELDPSEVEEINSMTDEQILALFGITEEQIEALGYDSGKHFAEEVKAGLDDYSEEDYINAADKTGNEKAKGLDLDVDELDVYRDLLAQTYPELTKNRKALNDVAIANKRMEKGVKTLADDWKDFNDIMADGEASIEDVSSVLPDINNGLQDILNISDEEFELLPPDFAQKNWKLIRDVVDGVEGSVDALRNKAGEEILMTVEGVVDPDGTMRDELWALHQDIAGFDELKFEIGIEINDENFIASCNDIIQKANMSAEQAQAYFASMGYDAKIKEVTIEKTAKRTIEYPLIDERTGYPTGKKDSMELTETTGTTGYAIETITPNGSYGGGIGVSTTTSQPKGATQSKKPQRTHQSDTVERYKEVTDKIDDTTDAMEDARRAAEGLWGPARIKKMREVQDEMRKEIGLLRQERVEAEKYLEDDRNDLIEIANGFGIRFEFENGNISNYTAVMNALHEDLRRAEMAINENPTETNKKALDDIEYKISEIKKAIGIYDETRETLENIDNEIEDKILELQQEKLDEINLELEVDLVVNETQLKELEYELSKLEDNFFGMAEAFALMVGKNDRGFNQLETYVDSLGDYQEQYNRLLSNYTTIDATTERTLINQAQFIEGLQEVQDGLYENLGNLQNLNKEMMQYYSETLAAAAEELEKFTSLMDHHNEVLDHYSSLLELLGRSKEWKTIQNVLETQVSTAENAAKVSKSNYDMLAEQAEQMKKAYDAGEVTEEQWLAAQNAANEAQNQMLEDAEVWAEALKSLLENRLEELADILNKALSGDFGSLDNMISSMERSNSLQEEYLTTTNQIYETNKLMRTAQQEIDKTTNSVAKRRLKQFIDETNQMQNQNKLSQYELEIQQAKYDLLLAEIALEEAQQAKSTVRLQRDSEGNFGYVYTADQNQVAQAQQDLEDAQNSLYNIGLEGANKYAENYAQTLQEMNDAITELTRQWQEGEITSKEEYQRKMTELEEYYNKKLLQYSELRTIALSTDSRVMADAWSQDFADMTYKTQDWMNQVSEYVKGVERAMSDYQGNMDRVEEHVGLDIDSLEEKTSNLKDANTQLSGEIKDELIPSLRDEIDAVADLTKEYIKLYASIMETIGGYEDLATAIGKRIENESNSDDSNNLQPTGVGTSDSSGSSGNSGAGQVSVGGRIDAGSAEIHDFPGAPGERQYFRNDPTYTVLEEQGDWIKVRHHSLSSGVTGWFRKDQLAGYDTGGYTGNWEGSYGKLALLHKKELILNEGDTENFLAGMDVLNKIISTIDLYSLNAQLGGLLSTPSYGGFGDRDSIEQNVHIEASFPNVSDHNEIEEALSTLINRASQFASRK